MLNNICIAISKISKKIMHHKHVITGCNVSKISHHIISDTKTIPVECFLK